MRKTNALPTPFLILVTGFSRIVLAQETGCAEAQPAVVRMADVEQGRLLIKTDHQGVYVSAPLLETDVGLVAASAVFLGRGAWILAKAQVAQVLLARGWETTKTGGEPSSPGLGRTPGLWPAPDRQVRRYRVSEAGVVDHRNRRPLAATGEPALTLITCYPFDAVVPGGPLRYVVRAGGM